MGYVILFVVLFLFFYCVLPHRYRVNFYSGAGNHVLIEGSDGFLARVPIEVCVGRERICVPNPFDAEKYSFNGKLLDAIELVDLGVVDEIFVDGNPKDYYRVTAYRYLDREYGEKMRKITKQVWKERAFSCVAFALCDPNRIDYAWALNNNGKAILRGEEPAKEFYTEMGAGFWAKKMGVPFVRTGHIAK